MSQASEIKKALKDGKLIIGWNSVERSLKTGGVKKVFISNTSSENLKRDVLAYSSIANFSVEDFPGTAFELGVLCKKPFPVSVLGIKE